MIPVIIVLILVLVLWGVNSWRDIISGWRLIKNSFLIFKKYPQFIIPLLIQQVISAPILLYLAFGRGYIFDTYFVWILLAAVFCIALLLTVSCLILLEFIDQLETAQTLNTGVAVKKALGKDAFKALPLVIIWTIVWFILLIIEALLSKAERQRENLSAEGAAKVLRGASTNLNEGLFAILEKGIRMSIFFILPSIAWEGLGFARATSRAFRMVRSHLSVFVSGFVLATIVQTIVFLPAGIIFALADNTGIQFPVWVWVVTILYIFFAWSYTIYTEQMLSANLYLWDLKWQKAVKETPTGLPAPKFEDVSMPSILNDNAILLSSVKPTQ